MQTTRAYRRSSISDRNEFRAHEAGTHLIRGKYKAARHVAYGATVTLITLPVVVVAVSAPSGDHIGDSEGSMAPEGGGFGVEMSSSPSSKYSSAVSLPNALGPMSIDPRIYSIGVKFNLEGGFVGKN